jgi:hypothetical protein
MTANFENYLELFKVNLDVLQVYWEERRDASFLAIRHENLNLLSNRRCHAGSTAFTMIPVQLYLEFENATIEERTEL